MAMKARVRTVAGAAFLLWLILRRLQMLLLGGGDVFGTRDAYQDSTPSLSMFPSNETGRPASVTDTDNVTTGRTRNRRGQKNSMRTSPETFSEQDCTSWSGPNRTKRSRNCRRRCSSSLISFRQTTEEGRWCRRNCPPNCEWFPLERQDRFPTVERRVKLYMHRWFHPCRRQFHYTRHDDGPYPVLRVQRGGHSNQTVVDAVIDSDKLLLLDRPFLEDCARRRKFMKRDQQSGAPALLNTSKYIVNRGLRTYCSNVQDLLDINDRLNIKHARTTPLVASFGDGLAIDRNNNRMPLFGKWRKAMTHQEMERLTNTRQCQDHDLAGEIPPIIWKLETLRHWNPIEPSILQDTIWENKTAMATWRGAFTGTAHHKTSDTNMTELEHCQANRRCRFVWNHAKSKLIDAGIDNTLGFISDTVNGVKITKERLSMAAIQGRKAIISFEGNDVASGLKWSLLSQSVVLMPRPTRTSWAMEELLEPWVHYIPMSDDGSNAEEMVRWMIDNDEKAKQIAERSTLFMYDLLYHPDAERENREVNEEIVRRYQEWWL